MPQKYKYTYAQLVLGSLTIRKIPFDQRKLEMLCTYRLRKT